MNNEQPPGDDDQGAEPTVAKYQRAGASKLPRHPAGQRAAVEGMLTARGMEPTNGPDPRALLDRLLDGRPQLADLALRLVTAAVESGVVITDGRPVSSLNVVSTLRRGRRTQMLAERAAQIAAEFTADLVPMAHALAQLADTRKAGEQAVETTPAMIRRAKAEGMKPKDIARLLQVTESHVYAVLRKQADEEPTAVEDFLAQVTGEMAQAAQEAYEARRARVPEGRTLYTYRIEQFGVTGDEWQEWGSGDTDAVPGTEAQVAADLLANAEAEDESVRMHRVRVLIWEGPEGDADDALYFHDREPGAE